MKHTLIFLAFLASNLYCNISNATEVDFLSRPSLDTIELAPLPGIDESSVSNMDDNDAEDENLMQILSQKEDSRHPQEMVALLKENGATGFTSSWNFDLELTPENIQKQIDNGANPNTQKEEREYGSYGNLELKTPLTIAIETDNVPAVKTLLENKVILNGSEALFHGLGKEVGWLQKHPTNIEIVKLLLDAGINPNSTEKRTHYEMRRVDYTTSPLIIAIQKDEVELVKLLLKYGANPNQMVDNRTPLMYSVSPIQLNHRLEIMKVLLQSGADINKRNSEGRNVLFYVRDMDTDIREFFLENGVDVNNPKDIELSNSQMLFFACLLIFIPILIGVPILRALEKGIRKRNLMFVILCSLFSPIGFFFSLIGPIFPWLISILIVRCSDINPEIALKNMRMHMIVRLLVVLITILILLFICWTTFNAFKMPVIV